MSLLQHARCSAIPPTFPCARWQPPPSGLQPSGLALPFEESKSQVGKGPLQFFSENQGSRSISSLFFSFFFFRGRSGEKERERKRMGKK